MELLIIAPLVAAFMLACLFANGSLSREGRRRDAYNAKQLRLPPEQREFLKDYQI